MTLEELLARFEQIDMLIEGNLLRTGAGNAGSREADLSFLGYWRAQITLQRQVLEQAIKHPALGPHLRCDRIHLLSREKPRFDEITPSQQAALYALIVRVEWAIRLYEDWSSGPAYQLHD